MIWIAYTLATLWAVSTAYLSISFLIYMTDTLVGRIIGGMLALLLWVVAGVSPFLAIIHETGPVLDRLLKSEWVCAKSSDHFVTTITIVGNTPMSSVSRVSQCDLYARKGTTSISESQVKE